MLGSTFGVGILRCLTGTAGTVTGTNNGIFMGLLTSAPIMTVNASNIVTGVEYSVFEPTIGSSGYAREIIGHPNAGIAPAFDSTVYYNQASSFYYISNVAQIKFNKASDVWTANSSTLLTHFGLFTASSGGTLLAWGELTSAITVSANQAANVDVGSAILKLYAVMPN